MRHFVLDTNIVSLIVKREVTVVNRFDTQVTDDDVLLGCPVVWYEARRGLLANDARSQMARFRNLFESFTWQDYTQDDWTLAAQWRANRRAVGRPIADADLLIAVFTYNRNAVLITDNERDFAGLGVSVENWLN